MAFTRAHLALALLCLALCSTQVNSFSLRKLLAFGSSCLIPISPNQLPEAPAPGDVASNYMCFGFQFVSTHSPDPVLTKLRTWYATINNPLVNPYVLLGASSDESPVETFAENSKYYYPLDGAYGSGTNGTGYGGVPYVKSSSSGKFVYAASFQLPDFSGTTVTTVKLNAALANLGKRILTFFPAKGAKASRPGVTDFEITTYFVRQDPKFTSLTNTLNVTSEANPGGTLVVKGCKYI